MQKGLVSIMMPAYNAEEFIEAAVSSVVAQTYQHWELLVVNDGSVDGTVDIVLKFSDPRIRLINKENGGEASARNMALENSRGEFIAYLDADDAHLPHHLEVTVGYLNKNPHRTAVYTDGHHFNSAGKQLKSLSSRRRGPFEGRIFEELVRASDVFGPPICVVLRHNLVARHQLRYDTRIVIGPDWDFFIRYSDLANFGYIDDYTCLYRVHETNITVQVDMKKRAGYLTLCREKAIKLPSFNQCSPETRGAVFYDLLINLLPDSPKKQASASQWPQFKALPAPDQARLLRLMASQSISKGNNHKYVKRWLTASRELNPDDKRGALLASCYKISPALCRLLLRFKSPGKANVPPASPFADLQ